MSYIGDFAADVTVRKHFTTHEAAGGSVAPSSAFEAADVRVYKNGSATQRDNETGYTMTSPFDSVTGLHLIEIDLSDDTDVFFFSAGNDYSVVLVPSDETVDGQTVVRELFTFSIENRLAEVDVVKWLGTAVNEDTAGYPKVTIKVGIGTGELAVSSGLVAVSAITSSVVAQLFLINSGQTQSSAVAGSLVKEIAERIAKRVRSGELSSLPSQTVPSAEDMLAFLYERFRNRAVSSPTQMVLYAADGTTPLATWTQSEDAGIFEQTAAF